LLLADAVNAPGTGLDYFHEIMSDSIGRLYTAVLAARDLDPSASRTARLFQRGSGRMAKKLAEEAIEVVIDAVNGDAQAVIRDCAAPSPATICRARRAPPAQAALNNR